LALNPSNNTLANLSPLHVSAAIYRNNLDTDIGLSHLVCHLLDKLDHLVNADPSTATVLILVLRVLLA
jgi:hypothetical protein